MFNDKVSEAVAKKVAYIKAYFTKHPARTPVNINRVYGSPMLNVKEVEALYKMIKLETQNEHANDSSIIAYVLNDQNSVYPPTRSDEEMKVFFTAIQWTGTNVGSEIFGESS